MPRSYGVEWQQERTMNIAGLGRGKIKEIRHKDTGQSWFYVYTDDPPVWHLIGAYVNEIRAVGKLRQALLTPELPMRIERDYYVPSGMYNHGVVAETTTDMKFYVPPDTGEVFCEECTIAKGFDPELCAAVLREEEWNYFPTCDNCGMLCGYVKIGEEGIYDTEFTLQHWMDEGIPKGLGDVALFLVDYLRQVDHERADEFSDWFWSLEGRSNG